jgi:hypothetical protein
VKSIRLLPENGRASTPPKVESALLVAAHSPTSQEFMMLFEVTSARFLEATVQLVDGMIDHGRLTDGIMKYGVLTRA